MQPVIRFENVGKLYRLGTVGTGTIAHDIQRWWVTSVLHKEDPYLQIGETNDRSTKGSSEYVYALKDINLEVQEGDVLGIIGKNGAGKSTLLKLLSRVTAPTTGKIYTKGRIASLLEVGTGFHPELTGRENIYMNGSILGMKKHEIDRKLDEIIDFSGCERYIDTPVKRYSSGMMVRLGFAVAAHLDPEILVVDEVLAVGDAEFQKKAIGKMQDVSKGQGRTVLFVSHNMTSVKNLCTRGIILKDGTIDYTGDINETIRQYLKDQEERSIMSVNEIKDRSGNKLLCFTDIKFYNSNGIETNTFNVGDEMTITVFFDYQSSIKNAKVSRIDIGIRDLYDVSIAWLSSYIYQERIDLSKRCISFRIPQIHLNEGVYNINLYSTVDNEVADWVKNVSSINIFFGNYYKNGQTLPADQCPYVTDFKIIDK